MKFSSKVQKCGLSPMRKFHPYAVAAQAKGRKIYHLNIGQPDIETPKAYFEAVRHFDLPVLEYAPSPGMPVLIDAIRHYYDKLDMHFDAGDILITNGGSEALQIAFNCILDDGDEILIPEPFYPNYNTMVRTCGASIHPIPTSPHEGYRYADRARIEAEINEHTRAIVCTNPGNPTGVVLTPEEMRMLVDVAKEHGLFIIGDEAYREFVYAGEPLQSMGQFADAAENVIVIDTVSKRFSACGARIGCLITRNRELMAHAMKYAQCRLSVPTLDQVAAAALYDVGPEYFAAVREEYKRRRDTVMQKLQAIPGVVCECPKGAFYVMAALPVDDAADAPTVAAQQADPDSLWHTVQGVLNFRHSHRDLDSDAPFHVRFAPKAKGSYRPFAWERGKLICAVNPAREEAELPLKLEDGTRVLHVIGKAEVKGDELVLGAQSFAILG